MSGSTVRWLRRVGIGAAVLLVAGFAIGSLAGSKGAKSSSGDTGNALAYQNSVFQGNRGVSAPKTAGAGVPEASGVGAQDTTRLGTLQTPTLSDSVIKTADLAIECAKGRVDRAWNRAFDIAKKYGGFVLSSSQGGAAGGVVIPVGAPEPGVVQTGSGNFRSADIVIRVRADKFDLALTELSGKDLGKVVRRGISGQDVSQEFVDLNSRLRNARAQESILLSLMAKSKTVGDTIAVQQQLSQVQQQVEELTGRIRYLKDQTELATISVHIAEPGAFVDSSEGPSFTKAWRTAVDGLERMGTAALIGGIWLGPFALLAAVVIATRRWRARPVPQA